MDWRECLECPHGCAGRPAAGPVCLLLDAEFTEAMRLNWANGANRPGRKPNGWKNLPWDHHFKWQYYSKLLGHVLQAFGQKDPAQARKHWAAVACNANILFHHAESE